jgi:hypothetical protein
MLRSGFFVERLNRHRGVEGWRVEKSFRHGRVLYEKIAEARDFERRSLSGEWGRGLATIGVICIVTITKKLGDESRFAFIKTKHLQHKTIFFLENWD